MKEQKEGVGDGGEEGVITRREEGDIERGDKWWQRSIRHLGRLLPLFKK